MGGEGRKKPTMGKLVNLPEDIIVEILTRLPPKSLLRFKCASKRWRLLISSKRFIKTQLKKSITDPDLSRHHLIVYPCEKRYEIRSSPLSSVFDEEQSPTSYRHLQSMYSESNTFGSCNYLRSLTSGSGCSDGRFRMQILGSCNGLLLVSSTGPLIIWNPATRKTNTIVCRPPTQVVETSNRAGYSINYSLGYDESTDDYKIVRFSINMYWKEQRFWRHSNLNSRYNHVVETHIYSSRTCSWKKTDLSHCTILKLCGDFGIFGIFGRFVNGRLHWLGFEDNTDPLGWDPNRKGISRDIVCLDLAGEEEKFETMGGPECLPSILRHPKPSLKDLGGYLSLIGFTSSSEINVLVMMKYGDPRSWTKILKLVDFDQNPSASFPCAMPLWLNKNGDMAVSFGPDVVIRKRKDMLRNSPVNTRRVDAFDSDIFVESLVLPFGDQQHKR